MDRRRYLVSYDIADDRRRTCIFSCVSGFGEWLQYSVFVCDLTPRELVALRLRLRDLIHDRQDSVMIVDLGFAEGRGDTCFEFMGIRRHLPSNRGPTIV